MKSKSPSFIPPLVLPLFAITAAAAIAVVVKSAPDLGFVSAGCGPHINADPGLKALVHDETDYAINLVTPGDPGLCAVPKGRSTPRMFVYVWCPATASGVDCMACLAYARDELAESYCVDRYGAQITLVDCFVRYEPYGFC